MPITSEITIGAAPFTAAVQWVAKWVAARPVVPVQGGISLSIDPEGIQLAIGAFSENVTARALVDAESAPGYVGDGALHGHAIVSGRLLAEIAGALGKQDVVLSGGKDGESVVLTSGRFVMTLPTLAGDTYPTLPGSLPTIGTVEGDAFTRAVSLVAVGAGRDENPAWLNTMHVDFMASGSITIMGTNRVQVVQASAAWKPDGGVVVTPDAGVLAEAAASLAGPGTITVGSNERLLSLSTDTRSLTMSTVEVRDPAGKLTWPTSLLEPQLSREPEHGVDLDPAELALPLKRARIVRGAKGPIRFSLVADSLTLGAAEGETRQASDDTIAVNYDGPDFVAGYNPEYLAEALRSAPGAPVRFSFDDPRKPAVLTCAAEPTWRHVLFPIRLPN